MLHDVLPQAVRNVLLALISNTVEIVKLTALASVVSLGKMLYTAGMTRSRTCNAAPMILVAGICLAMLWPLLRLVSRFERRVSA